MATHSSILSWRIPWTEEVGELQSIESQRVGHDWSNWAYTGCGFSVSWCAIQKHLQYTCSERYTVIGSVLKTEKYRWCGHDTPRFWRHRAGFLCIKSVGSGWGGRWEGGSGWGTHVHPWLMHVNVWQKPPQYCKAISLQLNKLEKKNPWGHTRLCCSEGASIPGFILWCQSEHS